MRILGPERSSSTGTYTPSFFATSRTMAITRVWASGLPCDMLMRATFMPAWINASIMAGELLAGPSVHTILVRRPAVARSASDFILARFGDVTVVVKLSLIHISEPTRQAEISYAVFCL